jgi:hypothetical protein
VKVMFSPRFEVQGSWFDEKASQQSARCDDKHCALWEQRRGLLA